MFGLSGFDFAVGDAFQGETGAFGRFVDGEIVGSFHAAVFFRHVGAVCKGYQVYLSVFMDTGRPARETRRRVDATGLTFEAGLDSAALGTAMLRDRIVSHHTILLHL